MLPQPLRSGRIPTQSGHPQVRCTVLQTRWEIGNPVRSVAVACCRNRYSVVALLRALFPAELLTVIHVRFHRLVPRLHEGVVRHPTRAIRALYESA